MSSSIVTLVLLLCVINLALKVLQLQQGMETSMDEIRMCMVRNDELLCEQEGIDPRHTPFQYEVRIDHNKLLVVVYVSNISNNFKHHPAYNECLLSRHEMIQKILDNYIELYPLRVVSFVLLYNQ